MGTFALVLAALTVRTGGEVRHLNNPQEATVSDTEGPVKAELEYADALREAREAILTLFSSERERIWTAEEVLEAVGAPMMDVLTALARLTMAGEIERPAPAKYRWASRPANELAQELRRHVFGESF